MNLANQSRRVKSYRYYNVTNNNQIPNGANGTALSDTTLFTKAAGVADPIALSNVTRAYAAVTNNVSSNTAAPSAVLTGLTTSNGQSAGAFVVTPGGFAQNNARYQSVTNYMIAEYGSLSSAQRNTSYVKKAAQAFVRSLAAYPANKNGVADRNAFTFGHDAQLNFNTSFSSTSTSTSILRRTSITMMNSNQTHKQPINQNN